MRGISRHVWLELASPSLVFRLIHLRVDDGQGFLGSAMGGEDGFGLAVHVKGFGSWLRCSIHSWIAFSSSVTLWKTPRSSEPCSRRREEASRASNFSAFFWDQR
jgi:hypothetical protein